MQSLPLDQKTVSFGRSAVACRIAKTLLNLDISENVPMLACLKTQKR